MMKLTYRDKEKFRQKITWAMCRRGLAVDNIMKLLEEEGIIQELPPKDTRCLVCGKRFTRTKFYHPVRKYCSGACRCKAYRERKEQNDSPKHP